MNEPEPEIAAAPGTEPRKKRASRTRRWTVRGVKAFLLVLFVWLAVAYLILPLLWRHYEHNPALADAPKTTLTGQNIPGDPLNVGLIGAEDDVVRAMHAAGWSPADPDHARELYPHCGQRGL